MKLNLINDLLGTICQYNNVRITQTFTLKEQDFITVRCVPNTSILELTFLDSAKVERYKSVEEAAAVIDLHLNCVHLL